MEDDSSKSAEAHPAQVARRTGAKVHGIDPFELFCAYHLGITVEGTYRFQNVHDVARRFGVDRARVEEALQAYRMDPSDLVHSSFDVASAQVDVQVSPPGVDLVGLAQMHWESFLQAEPRARDWDRELEEDARLNEQTYGRKVGRRSDEG